MLSILIDAPIIALSSQSVETSETVANNILLFQDIRDLLKVYDKCWCQDNK